MKTKNVHIFLARSRAGYLVAVASIGLDELRSKRREWSALCPCGPAVTVPVPLPEVKK